MSFIRLQELFNSSFNPQNLSNSQITDIVAYCQQQEVCSVLGGGQASSNGSYSNVGNLPFKSLKETFSYCQDELSSEISACSNQQQQQQNQPSQSQESTFDPSTLELKQLIDIMNYCIKTETCPSMGTTLSINNSYDVQSLSTGDLIKALTYCQQQTSLPECSHNNSGQGEPSNDGNGGSGEPSNDGNGGSGEPSNDGNGGSGEPTSTGSTTINPSTLDMKQLVDIIAVCQKEGICKNYGVTASENCSYPNASKLTAKQFQSVYSYCQKSTTIAACKKSSGPGGGGPGGGGPPPPPGGGGPPPPPGGGPASQNLSGNDSSGNGSSRNCSSGNGSSGNGSSGNGSSGNGSSSQSNFSPQNLQTSQLIDIVVTCIDQGVCTSYNKNVSRPSTNGSYNTESLTGTQMEDAFKYCKTTLIPICQSSSDSSSSSESSSKDGFSWILMLI